MKLCGNKNISWYSDRWAKSKWGLNVWILCIVVFVMSNYKLIFQLSYFLSDHPALKVSWRQTSCLCFCFFLNVSAKAMLTASRWGRSSFGKFLYNWLSVSSQVIKEPENLIIVRKPPLGSIFALSVKLHDSFLTSSCCYCYCNEHKS